MKIKTVVLLLLCIVLSVIGFVQVSSKGKQEELAQLNFAKDKGTVKWYIRRAKILGEDQITIPTYVSNYAEIHSLDDAMARFRVILGEPVEKYTYVGGEWSLLTWYKFKVLDELSSNSLQRCVNCDSSADIPDDLLPLNVDEVLVPVPGGTLIVDGIKLIQFSDLRDVFSKGSSIEDISNGTTTSSFQVNAPRIHQRISKPQRFLLILSPDSSGMIGKLSVGPIGAFVAHNNGEITSIVEPNVISESLSRSRISSVDDLKAYTQGLKKLQ